LATTELPAWVRELDMSLVTHPQVLIIGNVRDIYLLPDEDNGASPAPYQLAEVIERVCRRRGFATLAQHDLVHDRMVIWPLTADPVELPAVLIEYSVEDSFTASGSPDGDGPPDDTILRRARRVLREVVANTGAPIALVYPYAGRLGSPRAETTGEAKLFLGTAEAVGYEARQVRGAHAVMPYNTVFWVAERQEELPRDFASSSRALRVITIPAAPAEQRLETSRLVVANLMREQGTATPEEAESAAADLALLTHGLNNAEILTVGRMAADQNIPVHRLEDAVRLYRTGVRDNPWATESLRAKIAQGESLLNGDATKNNGGRGVVGQDRAVRKALQIFRRSAAGLTGAQSSSSPNRPRGVLFLAGPTGVGKTELAKGIAGMLFGPDAYPIRFDMSEFKQEHARERLIGAPPGYVGFDAGGELTNAVRANPMSVLLFDEIDKANPTLFDLFLQILEDGRLTDGRGSTVHFTESVVIFTSNLGTTEKGPNGVKRFTFQSDPQEVRQVLEQSFRTFFDNKIERPELRNRLGDAFIAMDFIQPEHVPDILAKAIASVRSRVKVVHQAQLEIGPEAMATLTEQAIDNLEHGGRGVNHAVELLLVNPLSRELLEQPVTPGEHLTVVRIEPEGPTGEGWLLEVKR
jgi:energy-coupling factor transporter ATP-binding protein EcfA2